MKKLGNLVSVPKAVTALYVGHPYANYTSKAYFLQHRKDYLVIVGFNFFHLNLVNYTKGMRKLQNASEKKKKGRRIILIKNRKKKSFLIQVNFQKSISSSGLLIGAI